MKSPWTTPSISLLVNRFFHGKEKAPIKAECILGKFNRTLTLGVWRKKNPHLHEPPLIENKIVHFKLKGSKLLTTFAN